MHSIISLNQDILKPSGCMSLLYYNECPIHRVCKFHKVGNFILPHPNWLSWLCRWLWEKFGSVKSHWKSFTVEMKSKRMNIVHFSFFFFKIEFFGKIATSLKKIATISELVYVCQKTLYNFYRSWEVKNITFGHENNCFFFAEKNREIFPFLCGGVSSLSRSEELIWKLRVGACAVLSGGPRCEFYKN